MKSENLTNNKTVICLSFTCLTIGAILLSVGCNRDSVISNAISRDTRDVVAGNTDRKSVV